MILAEAVSLDGDAIFLLLVILILMFAATVALVVAGFKLAAMAGRGSTPALVGWIAIGILELLPVLTSRHFVPVNLFGPALLALQALWYWRARAKHSERA